MSKNMALRTNVGSTAAATEPVLVSVAVNVLPTTEKVAEALRPDESDPVNVTEPPNVKLPATRVTQIATAQRDMTAPFVLRTQCPLHEMSHRQQTSSAHSW